MASALINLVRIWDKISARFAFLETIKKRMCLLRWNRYLKSIKQYEKSAQNKDLKADILVILGTGIGNAVESTPLVRAIRETWPKSKITIRPPKCGLFQNWPGVDKVIESPCELKGLRFDHTFVAWAGSISANKGYCPLGRMHITQDGLNIRAEKPESQYNIDMLRRLGYDSQTPKPFAFAQQPQIDIPESDFRICIAPGGKSTFKWRHKRWPYFNKLIDLLLEKYPNIQLCILGAKNDLINGSYKGTDNIIDLRGKLTWPETAWMIKNSTLAVGNDCGPMHITGATDTPAVIIFGPTCEIKNAPAGRFEAVRHLVTCSPCQYDRLLLTCKNPVCMNDLKAEYVLYCIEKMLNSL